jgi:4-carboxymuconolactone decarboxylase
MRIFAAMAISFCMLASGAHSQTSKDQGAIRMMRSGSQPSRQGPAENFTGSVRVDPLFQPNALAHPPAGPNLNRDCGHGPRATLE